MRGYKLVLGIVILILIALGFGFAWGASGRVTAQKALDTAQQQLDLADARGHILDARVSLYNVNFGDAQRDLDDAKAPLTRAHDRAPSREVQNALSAALSHVQEAQRLASRLDPNANNQANEALKSIQIATSK